MKIDDDYFVSTHTSAKGSWRACEVTKIQITKSNSGVLFRNIISPPRPPPRKLPTTRQAQLFTVANQSHNMCKHIEHNKSADKV